MILEVKSASQAPSIKGINVITNRNSCINIQLTLEVITAFFSIKTPFQFNQFNFLKISLKKNILQGRSFTELY